MKLLDRRDVLPLRDFVCIDLDRIREALPEHPQYVAADPERAGLLTQAEAGTIGEVATEEAFRRGRHVWIDSTLRDGGWWSREIARIRATYPRYKLAILLVEASWPRVLHRSRRRSEATGRGIPEPILRSVFEQARRRRRHRLPRLHTVPTLYSGVAGARVGGAAQAARRPLRRDRQRQPRAEAVDARRRVRAPAALYRHHRLRRRVRDARR